MHALTVQLYKDRCRELGHEYFICSDGNKSNVNGYDIIQYNATLFVKIYERNLKKLQFTTTFRHSGLVSSSGVILAL